MQFNDQKELIPLPSKAYGKIVKPYSVNPTLSCKMMRMAKCSLKILAVWKPHNFQSMFGHFSSGLFYNWISKTMMS